MSIEGIMKIEDVAIVPLKALVRIDMEKYLICGRCNSWLDRASLERNPTFKGTCPVCERPDTVIVASKVNGLIPQNRPHKRKH